MNAELVAALAVCGLGAVLNFASTAIIGRNGRAVTQHDDERRRLAQLEGKVQILDVAGTQGTQAALAVLRRDIEALETLHRTDVATIDNRVGSLAVSVAQLAERLNGFEWTIGPRAQGRTSPQGRPAQGERGQS